MKKEVHIISLYFFQNHMYWHIISYDMLSLVVEKHDDLWTKLHIGKCWAAAMFHYSPTSSQERSANPANPHTHTGWFTAGSPMLHYPGILNLPSIEGTSPLVKRWNHSTLRGWAWLSMVEHGWAIQWRGRPGDSFTCEMCALETRKSRVATGWFSSEVHRPALGSPWNLKARSLSFQHLLWGIEIPVLDSSHCLHLHLSA